MAQLQAASPEERADIARSQLAFISVSSTDNWNAAEMAAPNGASAFCRRHSHTLVVDASENVFSGVHGAQNFGLLGSRFGVVNWSNFPQRI